MNHFLSFLVRTKKIRHVVIMCINFSHTLKKKILTTCAYTVYTQTTHGEKKFKVYLHS